MRFNVIAVVGRAIILKLFFPVHTLPLGVCARMKRPRLDAFLLRCKNTVVPFHSDEWRRFGTLKHHFLTFQMQRKGQVISLEN